MSPFCYLLFHFLLVMNVCGKNDVDMRTYLKKKFSVILVR